MYIYYDNEEIVQKRILDGQRGKNVESVDYYKHAIATMPVGHTSFRITDKTKASAITLASKFTELCNSIGHKYVEWFASVSGKNMFQLDIMESNKLETFRDWLEQNKHQNGSTAKGSGSKCCL